MIAYCGLRCDSCLIFLATLEQDTARQLSMRKTIAAECSRHYGMQLKPEDVADCDGCKSETGRLFSGCLNCEIRICAGKKNIESCAYCSDYGCDKLRELFKLDAEAQVRLEEMRKSS